MVLQLSPSQRHLLFSNPILHLIINQSSPCLFLRLSIIHFATSPPAAIYSPCQLDTQKWRTYPFIVEDPKQESNGGISSMINRETYARSLSSMLPSVSLELSHPPFISAIDLICRLGGLGGSPVSMASTLCYEDDGEEVWFRLLDIGSRVCVSIEVRVVTDGGSFPGMAVSWVVFLLV
ncbi:hypothetical protein F2Q68_00005194 [Brassica cretica]|uniref:Uncharacterized protein n=1 Tax=Brassica cretica TaxID=69181 RepID=A0A8S9JBW0_BRACR|nr:hypothetical protein F2Q68_00005194 [Brassica cretica]